MFKEFRQLDHGAMPDKAVFGHIDPDKLTKNEKRVAFEAVNIIREKI